MSSTGFGFGGLRGRDRRRGLLLVSALRSVSEPWSGEVFTFTVGLGSGLAEESTFAVCCVLAGFRPRLGRRREREPDEVFGF